MIKKIIGTILLVVGAMLSGFILWAFLPVFIPDRYGMTPHLTSREIQAGVELGILAAVLLVSGILLLLLSRKKKLKGADGAKE